MEALDDAPLEFHDDVEVALPEVVCSWRTPDDSADADADAVALPSVPLLPVLPTVGAALVLDQQQDTKEGRGSPTRRRTCAALASLLFARRASAPETRPRDDDQPPPILAALAAVAPAPDRPHGGGGPRCLDPFHYSVSPASPPRPCGRVHSAITLSSAALEELRTPTLDGTSAASAGSCEGQHESKERDVGDTTANDVHLNANAQSVLAVRFARSLHFGADRVSIPVDPDPPVVGRGSPPRLLPPIAVRSCNQPRSPRKPAATQ